MILVSIQISIEEKYKIKEKYYNKEKFYNCIVNVHLFAGSARDPAVQRLLQQRDARLPGLPRRAGRQLGQVCR